MGEEDCESWSRGSWVLEAAASMSSRSSRREVLRRFLVPAEWVVFLVGEKQGMINRRRASILVMVLVDLGLVSWDLGLEFQLSMSKG